MATDAKIEQLGFELAATTATPGSKAEQLGFELAASTSPGTDVFTFGLEVASQNTIPSDIFTLGLEVASANLPVYPDPCIKFPQVFGVIRTLQDPNVSG